MPSYQDASGFTLIELVIVVTLVGIFSALAVPSFVQFVSNNRTQATANEALSLLQYARSYAVTNRTEVKICHDDEDGTLTAGLSCDDSDALRKMSAASGVTLAVGDGELTYRHNGSAASTKKYIFCHGNDAANGFTLDVKASGHTSLYPRGKKSSADAMNSCEP